MAVYQESNIGTGIERYPYCSKEEQRFRTEADFYQYLSSVFFRQPDSFYAIWEDENEYKAALRIEPYHNSSMLLCALETAPEARKKGYATLLIESVLSHLRNTNFGTVYSHVSKVNTPSLAVHLRTGFRIIKNHAVYSDGSVLNSSYTLAFTINKSEI